MSVRLALDVGSETIGLAVCNDAEDQVRALYTLTRLNRRRDVAAVADEFRRQGARVLVVGLATLASGDEGESAARARRLGELIAAAVDAPLVFVDEHLTTELARERLEAQFVSPARLAEQLDAEAARIILERHLAALREERETSE